MQSVSKYQSYLLFAILISCICCIHYFLFREDTTLLLGAYSLGFLAFYFLSKSEHISWKELLWLAIVSRLVLFFSLPNLSDDFYRFVWDGRLIFEGINPYAYPPDFFVDKIVEYQSLSPELFQSLNSKPYFSIYPPLSQFIFWLSVVISPNSLEGSVLVMRSVILIFEIGSLFLLKSLLTQNGLSTKNSILYALNPLIILELCGNLHFEGIMIFFLLLFIYLYQCSKIKQSAVAIALGITTKLVPLMFLPAVMRKLKQKKLIAFYGIVAVVMIASFLPFLDKAFITGWAGSLDLFFRKFEFNSGLFFLFRAIGFYFKGYDVIGTIGPLMSITALILILSYCLFVIKKDSNISVSLLVILFIQLTFATTVHPWYIIPLLAFSATTNFRFPIVWSFLIFFTYSGYRANGFEHPFLVMAVEYLLVIPMAVIEILNHHNINLRKML
ncbi:MAG: hypothetical protein JXQ96_00110 [Cyclobacteriaceae bacterium]